MARHEEYQGARLVSGVFFAASIVVLVLGTAGVLIWTAAERHSGHALSTAVALGAFGATVISAAALAFFGYVLSLLIDIRAALTAADEVIEP